jgi:hypothetical protein
MHTVNPYFDDNEKPVLRRSYCVFMDVLGFSDHIAQSFSDGNGQIALDRFYGVFTEQLQAIFNRDIEGNCRTWDVKVFTDNIVLGYAFDSWHAEPELASVFDKVGCYQLLMTLENFFIRGAISVGDLFLDENTAFGPTLLEAHTLESTRARDPRVVLSSGVVDYLRKHIGFYRHPRHAPQMKMVLADADGEVFVHYLHYLVGWADDTPYITSDSLAKHKENVIHNLEANRGSPKVWAKYQWVANYHNFFCDQCHHYDDYHDDLRIEREMLQISPTTFVPIDAENAT